MYDVKSVLSKIVNSGYRVKINHRTVRGKTELFCNYRYKVDGRTKQEFRKLVTLGGEKKSEDLLLLKQANQIREELEAELDKGNRLTQNSGNNTYFCKYVDKIYAHHNKNTAKVYAYQKRYVVEFMGRDVLLSEIDKQFCMKFWSF